MSNTRSTRPISQRPGRPKAVPHAPRQQSAPFDLSAVQNDGSQEPFRFTLGDDEFALSNPQDLDYAEVEAAGDDPYENVRLLMDPDTFERFREHSLTVRQLVTLATEANRYYAVGEGLA